MKDLRSLKQYRLRDEEIKMYGADGGSYGGLFKVYVEGKSFFRIASSGGGWEHVSVSPCSKHRKTCPTLDEMCAIKDMFFKTDECVVQYHPPRSDYVNIHPYCLHLWRPKKEEIPMPPIEFV